MYKGVDIRALNDESTQSIMTITHCYNVVLYSGNLRFKFQPWDYVVVIVLSRSSLLPWWYHRLFSHPVRSIIQYNFTKERYIVRAIDRLCRSQWPRGLRRGSATSRLLEFWVEIPPGVWMSVCWECCVSSVRGLCDELIIHPEESYW